MYKTVGYARKRPAAVFLGVLAGMCTPAFALNPSLDVSQYSHAAWLIRDGFPKGAVRSIAQSGDGYLWLGTEFGLVRFDGVRAVAWPPPDQHLPSNNIRSVLVAHDGTLWIGTLEGLASWKDGKLARYPETAGQNVFALLEDREGTVWAGTFGVPSARLCEIRGGKAKCYGQDGSLGEWVYLLYEDSAGRLWVGGMGGLWQWRPGPPRHYPLPYFIDTPQSMVEDDNRSGLLCLNRGIRRIVNGRIEDYPLAGVRWPFTPRNILRDQEGALWVGTVERGLLHVYEGRTDSFSQQDGLTGDNVLCSFEDREGNIWVATSEGLDRFRNFAAVSISPKQGLSSPSAMTVLVTHDGAVWIGTQDGLNKWHRGEFSIYRGAGWHATAPEFQGVNPRVREIIEPAFGDDEAGALYEDARGRLWVSGIRGIARLQNGRFTRLLTAPAGWVNVITGDGGDGVWMAYQDLGLQHLVRDQVVEQIPWSRLGHGVASSMIPDARKKGLWLGFFQGGVVYLQDGQVRAEYSSQDGLGGGRVMGLDLDGDGTLWAATEGGLSRIHGGRIMTLKSANGLPCDGVHWAAQQADAFWLYTPCGLIRVPRPELDAWISQPKRLIQRTIFDASDGVRIKALLTGYTPRFSQSADGKIWFAHLDSVSVIDPRHLPFNKLPPPVYIEQVRADGKTYEAGRGLNLPALVRDVWIDYTALSLVAPQKVHFKYKLEGQDQEWKEVVNERQAHYTNLKPRRYRFLVSASNDSGRWNETGATLEFSVTPAFFQTNWFVALCTAVGLVIIWGLYRLRLYQIAREFHANLEGRLDERLRVARELHDTLLQSFQGLMFSFQAARNLLPARTEQAMRTLDEAILAGDQAIAEGRNTIQDLRAHPPLESNLEYLLRDAGNELLKSSPMESGPPGFQVIVEGSRQPLSPVLQDELYRMARELLRNAFHHAQASRVEAEITYDTRFFRLRIRDNGKGIDRNVLKHGACVGHWGLPGIRERAKRIRAQLKLWSEPGAGTEAELTVPARIAYGTRDRGQGLRLSHKGRVES